ncbi:hypothetical protein LCGC14_1864020 [marine sediment metagenome]|uniref:Uncharacterized protein n=2 Tax=root TaxID=1 RepID=A0A831QPR4_9FLAO|nr:hypothetical protein [Pricia antarctica]
MERKRIFSKLLGIAITTVVLILFLTVSAYYFPEMMKAWIYFPLVGLIITLSIVLGTRGIDALNRSEERTDQNDSSP